MQWEQVLLIIDIACLRIGLSSARSNRRKTNQGEVSYQRCSNFVRLVPSQFYTAEIKKNTAYIASVLRDLLNSTL